MEVAPPMVAAYFFVGPPLASLTDYVIDWRRLLSAQYGAPLGSGG
jgi:hypothetical protein